MDSRTHLKAHQIIIFLILLTFGASLSVYYILHYQEARYGFNAEPSFCTLDAYLDCDSLQHTRNAALLGIPMGAWALFYFLTFIQLLMLYQRHPKTWIFRLLMGWAVLGVLAGAVQMTSALLIYQKLCLTCAAGWLVLFALGGCAWKFLPRPQGTFHLNFSGMGTQAVISLLLLSISLVIVPNLLMASQLKKTIQYSDEVIANKLSMEPYPIPEGILRPEHPQGDYFKGSLQAKVTLLVFHDFQCPICIRQSEVFKRLLARFPNDILFVFKNFPLDQQCNPTIPSRMHPQACYWAEVGRCLGRKDARLFWRFYDIYTLKKPTAYPEIQKYFSDISTQALESCLDANQEMLSIQTDITHGQALYVSGTPTFFVNGYRFEGYTPYYLLEKLVTTLLKQK